jgi:hypothetical protein
VPGDSQTSSLDRGSLTHLLLARSRAVPSAVRTGEPMAPRSALASVLTRSSERRYGACPLGTTNDSELERREDTPAFPSEEERDPGQCSLDFS